MLLTLCTVWPAMMMQLAREERLRRRERSGRQTETAEERDARLKLTSKLHFSEGLLHRIVVL